MPSPTVGRELLELGLIDEIDLHIAPVLLGEGIRLCDNPGSEPIRLHRVGEGDRADRKRRVLTRHEGEDPDRDSVG